ncbi:hypothetical protein EV702DRAFT_1202190 [Suillus placidus]|uniref:Uncharacterized protein n=1 Tax=Suillus placidus TaxID=48579 RepID=A0A9P6ZN26_9AGAM|nr:hypothetical protein EV702DRAFT_1202190 [Suillus placidus]
MATKSEAFDHSKSAPPVRQDLIKKQKRTIVLSRIRDMVSTPNLTPFSITKIANACAATLPPAQFAHLLQKPNIEGHTVLYWSIVNHGREAFSALATFIPQFTPACSSDLRLACISTSDHELFMQLKLGYVVDPEDESLRRFLGCPPDEVQVYFVARHTPQKSEFGACFCIRMFQKRLRATHPTGALGMEFIAGGRIWLLELHMKEGQWCIEFSLSEDSLPASVDFAMLVIEAPSGKTALEDIRIPHSNTKFTITPSTGILEASQSYNMFYWSLGDWLINDKTMLDCDGTLHAKLELTST